MTTKSAFLVVIIAAAVILSGCASKANPDESSAGDVLQEGIDDNSALDFSDFKISAYESSPPLGENIFNDVTIISNLYGFRLTGAPQHELCAQMFFGRFEEYGLEARYQEFSWLGIPCKNVLGFKWGENRSDWIVFGAHYDTSITVQGAYDNAGGCAAVLELARTLSKYNFTKTMVFALWDAEEIAYLYGSETFVKEYGKANRLCNFNFDCIGLSYPCKNVLDSSDLVLPIGYNSGAKFEAFNSALRYAASDVLQIPIEAQGFEAGAGPSDHDSFGKRPWAYFFGDPNSAEILCMYNYPQDEYLTYVLAAGGPDELKKGLELPTRLAYYSAILYSECE